jgi:cell division protein FtsW (lipid II flippase)
VTENQQVEFFTKQTLSWVIGLTVCLCFVYFFASAGANEGHLPSLAAFFGAIYFLYKIITQAKSTFLINNPSVAKAAQSVKKKSDNYDFFAPVMVTIFFGPVFWFVLALMIEPRTDHEKLILIFGSLIVFFVISFVWFNKKS